MNFSEGDSQAVWKVLSAILLIGNLEFDESTYNDNNPCTIKNGSLLVKICELMGCKLDLFQKALTYKTREVGKQVIESPLPKGECITTREALSRALYDNLFSWLVIKLN